MTTPTKHLVTKQDARDYRTLLNRQDTGDSKHRHLRYQQRTRLYGDYLWHQDREKFNNDCADWVQRGRPSYG